MGGPSPVQEILEQNINKWPRIFDQKKKKDDHFLPLSKRNLPKPKLKSLGLLAEEISRQSSINCVL